MTMRFGDLTAKGYVRQSFEMAFRDTRAAIHSETSADLGSASHVSAQIAGAAEPALTSRGAK